MKTKSRLKFHEHVQLSLVLSLMYGIKTQKNIAAKIVRVLNCEWVGFEDTKWGKKG